MDALKTKAKNFQFDDEELEDLDFDSITDNEEDDVEFDEYIDDGTFADDDGTIISDGSLMEEEDYTLVSNDADFISDTGDIVVMDTNETGDNFKLVYVDIENIAIVQRIRKNNNVEDLVRSIKSTGLLSPIVVAPTATDNLYVLLEGYRRILACARAGKRRIPCIVNNKVNTPEIPVLEALYNHSKKYTIKEMIEYIEYLEMQKGIMSASMIEYLLQLNSGDYTKLKDILNDGDDDIISKLYDDTFTIAQAFKKLEQRRKKESAEEKDVKKADAVYSDETGSGAENIAGSGEEVDGVELSEEEIKRLAITANELDEGLEDASLDDMIQDGKDIKGYQTNKQDVNNRERIDPVLRKAVFARDNYTCLCCKRGGGSYVDVMEAHHVIPVFTNKGLNADIAGDSLENLITLCILCHRMTHLYSTNELQIPKEKTDKEFNQMSDDEIVIYKDEQMKFKRIVKLGTVIRKLIEQKGIKLEQYKKNNPSRNVGRQMPGYRNQINPGEAEKRHKEANANQ